MHQKTTQNHLIHIEVVPTNIGRRKKIQYYDGGILIFKLKVNYKRSLQCFLNADARFVDV